MKTLRDVLIWCTWFLYCLLASDCCQVQILIKGMLQLAETCCGFKHAQLSFNIFFLEIFFAKVYLHRRSAWCNSKVSWMFYRVYLIYGFFLLTCLLSESVMFGSLGAQVWEQNIANSDNRFVISKKHKDI